MKCEGCKHYVRFRGKHDSKEFECEHKGQFAYECMNNDFIHREAGRYAEIDGTRYYIHGCAVCPFVDAGDGGYGEFCRYPENPSMMTRREDSVYWSDDEERVPDDCPLRKNE